MKLILFILGVILTIGVIGLIAIVLLTDYLENER